MASSDGVDLQNGLVAYYPFNGNANDESGNGYNGVVYDAALIADRNGNSNSAYRFTDSDDRVDISVVPDLQTFTMSTWFCTTNQGPGTMVGFDGMYVFLLSAPDWLRGDTKAGSSSGGTWTGGPRATNYVADGVWHHMAAVRDDTNDEVTFYLDGIFQGTQSIKLDVLTVVPDGLVLGQDQDEVGGKFALRDAFKGKMDDLRVYNRVLNASEIKALAVKSTYSTSDNTRKNQ